MKSFSNLPGGLQPTANGIVDTGSHLCTHCGLCCNGALHDQAALDPDEINHATKLGLKVNPGKRPSFSMPCPRLSGSLCSIYRVRPRACARYQCRLLRSVKAGSIGIDEARSHVATARELLNELVRRLPPGVEVREMRHHFNPASPEARSKMARDPAVALASFTLSAYLDKHFRNEREGNLLDYEVVDEHGR